MAVERHEILGSEVAGNGDAEREDKGIPVGGESLSRIADVGDARHVGGKDRHSHHPAGNAVSCRGELVGTAVLLEERASEHHHTQREDDEDDEIN